MKKVLNLVVVLAVLFFATSCGVNNAIITNQNQNSTQVQLASNNYKVVEKISGNAEVTYVLCFGGMNKKQLFENAYSAMVGKTNLLNGSKALINIVTEEHLGGVPPFYYKRTVTVSAHVIEFTK
jgi:hypothetical protein